MCPAEYKKVNGENYKNCNRLESTTYWSYSTINSILHREMYVGNMVQGTKHQRMRSKQKKMPKEEWIIVENTHEPIIDKATWEKAQSLLQKRTRELDLETNKNIFAGFVKCGDCGRAMTKICGVVQMEVKHTVFIVEHIRETGNSIVRPIRFLWQCWKILYWVI